INPAYAGVVETELAQMKASGPGYDPILQAQAFPLDFTVESGEEEGTVIVDMAFANPHRLEVQMQQVGGQWLVSGVTRLEELGETVSAADPPDTSEWQTVTDLEHGFSFQIPPDWVALEQNLQGQGMPDDWPVLQHYLLMPAELAQAMAARSGPPAGDEMPLIPPITISYLQGDQAAFDRAFVPAAYTDTLQMNGREILVQRQGGEYPLPRYVFQDKQDPQRLLVVEDLVNEFPGREEQAAAIFDILDGILMTISFTE
ncbi:MAG: hypothetical protein R6X34_06135, partial [Chloroflexota bacterium]